MGECAAMTLAEMVGIAVPHCLGRFGTPPEPDQKVAMGKILFRIRRRSSMAWYGMGWFVAAHHAS